MATLALRFARQAHHGQHRKQTGEQYVDHPIAVARLVQEAGFDGSVQAAAYLHDVLEQSDIERPEIDRRFGPRVGELVDALSEDPSLEDYMARKRGLRRQVLAAGRNAAVIYSADRIANVRDWLSLRPDEREACGDRLGTTFEDRMLLWQEDLEELSAADPGLPFLDELEIDLRRLRSEANGAGHP